MTSYDLDMPLIEFKDEPVDWTLRDACNGIFIGGGIGSGKSSGSGEFLALKYLASGFGGLVLCAKSELSEWRKYCQMTERAKDLLVVSPSEKNCFNFLEYESRQTGDKSYTDCIVEVLKTVIRSSEEKSNGKSDDPFWETALDMLMSNTIDLCMIGYGTITVELLYNVALSVMNKSEDSAFEKALSAAKKKVQIQIDQWVKKVGQPHLKLLSDNAYNAALFEAVPDARQLKLVDQFFIDNFRKLSERTRSIVEFSFTGFLFHLLKEPVFSLFCDSKPSTFTPEDALNGRIIILDVPVKQYNKVGRDIQVLFKYIFQRAMERRDINQNDRPVFIWSDEAQHFLHEHDAEFQATCRSSMVCSVLISQNLPNLYASMGGEKSGYKIRSLLGTLATKVFHANSDTETNEYASSLIGEAYQKDISEANAVSEGKVTTTQTVSTSLKKLVRPEEFGMLKTGGPKNSYKVSGFIHVQGKQFSNGFNFRKLIFNQNVKPNL